MPRRYAAIVLTALVVMGLAASAFAETEQPKVEFASYTVVFAGRGPNWKSQSDQEGMEVRMEVIENLKKAIKSGSVIIAGVVNDGSGAEFIAIVQTDDDAALRKTLGEAKNVANGFFKLTYHSWYAPAGLKLETVARK